MEVTSDSGVAGVRGRVGGKDLEGDKSTQSEQRFKTGEVPVKSVTVVFGLDRWMWVLNRQM
jgi:hypothetical protein